MALPERAISPCRSPVRRRACHFRVSERGSTLGREIKSGVITFLTISYILLVNPQILGLAGMPLKAVVTATALSSMVSSFICGVASNLPVGLAPGMGLNAYLVFSQVLGLGVSVEKALAGCMVAAGVVALLAVARALKLILAAVPNSIKLAVVVGMGLLLTFIGLQTAKIVVPDPETMVTMGNVFALEPLLAIGGLAVIVSLHYRNVPGSIIVGVLLTALAYWAAKHSWPTQFIALPHIKIFKLDFSDLFSKKFNVSAWSAVLAYTLVMLFDIAGAMFGLGNLAGLVRDGHVPGSTWTYLAAAAGTALGAACGTTPLIIAAESAVGIKEGGRTGLVAVTVAACFGISTFLSPLLQSVPQLATAPVLVLVGAFMMGESNHIDWSSLLTAVPAFLTIVIQPFTFSIANGIYAGLLMSALLYVLTGGWLEALYRRKGGAEEAAGEQAPPAGGADLESPLLGAANGEQAVAAAAAASPRAVTSPRQNIPAGGAAVHVRQASFDGGEDSLPFELGSFTMMINTFGSAGSGLVGQGSRRAAGGAPQHPEAEEGEK